jgi:hypothetical protein
MDLQVETSLQGEVLFATLNGRAETNALVRLVKHTCDVAVEKRVDKILIDALALTGPLSAFERYEIGAQVTAYMAERGINPRIALVGEPPTTDGFAVRVAQNRGANAEVFQTVEKALEWLGAWPGNR